MSLDPESGRPLYMQLADVIEAKIASGEYAPDRMIPTPARLSEEYGIAQMTARRAMRELRERELVYTVPGKGSYVVPEPKTSDG
ncbi:MULTISPECIES: GntR family transcriptional regulator [Streptomyces]|uniref:Regulatory protein, gntR family n=1 Tax=Streptomyces pini TaxID=1520580 RepID=A0A1I4G712_9ACTN|nr:MULTISPECIES: winged helix-turn-helix domain-containing protein [Streptomyces]SFL24876.1 regulatory protein, gntR family [Streptomyces pini]